MKITEFFDETLGWWIFFGALLFCLYWFFGGSYQNKKIECRLQNPNVESNYNVFTGCWYWSERQKKMITTNDSKEKELAEQDFDLELENRQKEDAIFEKIKLL